MQFTHALSVILSLSCSFTHMQDHLPAATLSHFGCSTDHKQRVALQRTHTATFSRQSLTPLLSRSLSYPVCHSPSLQFTFQAAWPQNQFSNNSSHDFIQLGNFQCGSRVAVRSPLCPPLSTLHLWLCVVVFIPLRVTQAYYVAQLLLAARRQIFAWNMRRGRTSQRMSG